MRPGVEFGARAPEPDVDVLVGSDMAAPAIGDGLEVSRAVAAPRGLDEGSGGGGDAGGAVAVDDR